MRFRPRWVQLRPTAYACGRLPPPVSQILRHALDEQDDRLGTGAPEVAQGAVEVRPVPCQGGGFVGEHHDDHAIVVPRSFHGLNVAATHEVTAAKRGPSLSLMKFTGHERDIVGSESWDTLDYMHARYERAPRWGGSYPAIRCSM